MMDIFKKIHREDVLCLFILISPFLDLVSSLCNFGNFSISLFLRPIIPLGLLLYIFIKDKNIRKYLIIGTLIFFLYALIHLWIYRGLLTPFSYGGVLYEASYLCNYTYLIATLFLFLYIFRKPTERLKKCFMIYLAIYIISIYLAIITGTSFHTYVEGIGYRGWFNTGGAVGSILIASLFIMLPDLLHKDKYTLYRWLLVISVVIYLMFLLGTRVGLLGSTLALGCFLILTIFFSLLHKKKNKKIVIGMFAFGIILVIGICLFGSLSLSRRDQIADLTGKIPGQEDSQEVIYMAYDLVQLKESIDREELPQGFMLEEQKNALLQLDQYTRKVKLASTDLRSQQLIYHHFLYQNQKNILLVFFGNGYLTNMGMLTLEMELPALFYNFGIIGFILFFGPFLSLFGYGLYRGIRNYRKLTVDYLMTLAGCFMTYMISSLSGHTYFNTSVMIAILLLHTSLWYQARMIGKEKTT